MEAREKLNILLVDDQPAKLLSYESVLEELGQNLIKANSARDALEMLIRHQIAVILIDVCMPELDGFELARMIREHPRYQTTAIIFVSAVQVTDLDLMRGYEEGAVDYVPVPVAPSLLRAKVRVFLDLFRKTHELEQFNAALEARVAERTLQLADANAALEHQNGELERRVEERTRAHEASLSAMHQMQKLESLGQLTGGIAHDFNNLLMAILGHLEVLEKRLGEDQRSRSLLEGAVRAAEHGANLTKRMLAFARRQELKSERLDVVRLILGMTEMLSRSLGPSCQLVTELPDSLPAIHTDPNQLELALLNLVLNARDAMATAGQVVIAAERQQAVDPQAATGQARPYVSISVVDRGLGMDEATLKRATEPFFTTKELGKGTGLGLSMVHGLMMQSGGFLKIASQPGEGTTVSLFFPEQQADTGPAVAPAATSPPTGVAMYKVLVVEDDELVSDAVAAMLEDLGHAAFCAKSASDALSLLTAGLAIDCVISDHAMPGMTGLELAAELRRRWPDLPIIVATGYADALNHEGASISFLSKPYRQQALADLLVKLLAAKPAMRL
ncbi:hybrid sensor histidine kinase/response regulator [Aliidongia dinghuensis]|uniref:histidine kinase n=1 Tax=Aliidongia dinghuensis TaxID=1867774 RepID=A0A8J2YRX4_9PROT|nr:response regulator [Aliidongia dinghuensis]GGF11358.1 hybrid sensor histidine kinase/response regulator [Aliidongia dinghuensis]